MGEKSVFTKIVNGEIPCYKVAEDHNNLAFLDIYPLVRGHTLVIPKKEVDYIFDLEDNDYMELFLFAKKVAKAMDRVLECKRIGMAVLGLEVPHAHIHLVPIDSIYDIDFSKPKLDLSDEEFIQLSDMIARSFDG